MSNVVKFNFEKNPNKVVEINGEQYTIDGSDVGKTEQTIAIQEFGKAATELASYGKDIAEMSKQDLIDFNKKQTLVMKNLIDVILGGGQFEKMYELAGHSTANLMPLVEMLMEVVGGGKEQIDKAQQYMKNVKK